MYLTKVFFCANVFDKLDGKSFLNKENENVFFWLMVLAETETKFHEKNVPSSCHYFTQFFI